MALSLLVSKMFVSLLRRIKMAQLTNKCSDEDIEYYIRECGDILGVTQQVENPDDPKAILHYIFQEIVKYKCSNLS